MDLIDETYFLPRLIALQECVCSELEKAGAGSSLCFCGIVPAGRPPIGLMDCGPGKSCGVAWVAPANVFPYTVFPQPATAPIARCSQPMAMQVQIGVARCHPRPPQGKGTLDPQDTFNATRLYLSDMAAVKRAILCCFPKRDGDYQATIQSWEPMPAEASVSGGIWTAVIG